MPISTEGSDMPTTIPKRLCNLGSQGRREDERVEGVVLLHLLSIGAISER